MRLEWHRLRFIDLTEESCMHEVCAGMPCVGMPTLPYPFSHQLKIHVHLRAGVWKVLSVQFSAGTLRQVVMQQGLPGQLISVEHTGSSFTASERRRGLAWPNGHAATVTFSAQTNMSSVRIDYASTTTYITYYKTPGCNLTRSAPCPTVTVPAAPPRSGPHVHGSQVAVIFTRHAVMLPNSTTSSEHAGVSHEHEGVSHEDEGSTHAAVEAGELASVSTIHLGLLTVQAAYVDRLPSFMRAVCNRTTSRIVVHALSMGDGGGLPHGWSKAKGPCWRGINMYRVDHLAANEQAQLEVLGSRAEENPITSASTPALAKDAKWTKWLMLKVIAHRVLPPSVERIILLDLDMLVLAGEHTHTCTCTCTCTCASSCSTSTCLFSQICASCGSSLTALHRCRCLASCTSRSPHTSLA